MIKVGIVLKAHGLRGDLKIKAFTDDPYRFKKYPAFEVAGVLRKRRSFTPGPDSHILNLEGVDSKEAADKLRGQFLLIDRKDAGKGTLISDYIGLKVVCDRKGADKTLGTVESYIEAAGIGYLEILSPEGKRGLVPCDGALWGEPDASTGTARLTDPEGLYLQEF